MRRLEERWREEKLTIVHFHKTLDEVAAQSKREGPEFVRRYCEKVVKGREGDDFH